MKYEGQVKNKKQIELKFAYRGSKETSTYVARTTGGKGNAQATHNKLQ